MEKLSYGSYGWIGEGDPPVPQAISLQNDDPPDPEAILVSGDLEPSYLLGFLRERTLQDIPWIVLDPGDRLQAWSDAGACGFVSSSSSPDSISACLIGISRLNARATMMNPLSGLPGNTPIARVLKEEVVDGDSTAAYFDISGFKPFNDYYGFSRGDAVLRALASILRSHLSEYFVGHVGGDDFVAAGVGEDFREKARTAARVFNGRAGGFYSGIDHSAGGIEALDRTGEFRFYPVMELTVSLVDGRGCSSVEELAEKAGREKKRLKGELMPDTVASFLAGGRSEGPGLDDFREWVKASRPGIHEIKTMIEAAGILGDTGMTACLVELLEREEDYRVRKSAARALGNMAAPDSVKALVSSLEDDNPHVRTTAIMALSMVLGEEAGPYLEKATADSSTWVRRAALRGLGVSGWSGASIILRKELESSGGGRYWLNRKQELASALEGAAILGDSELASSVRLLLHRNPGVSRKTVWKTLMTLGGSVCFEELLKAFEEDDYFVPVSQLLSLDPKSLSDREMKKLEKAVLTLDLRRRTDRIHVLRFLGRVVVPASPDLARWLLEKMRSTEDSSEFEVLMDTLKARGVTPTDADLESVLKRWDRGRLKLGRKGLIRTLRWVSTGSFPITAQFLEQLIRNDSREVREAAARAALSISRKRRPSNI